MSTKSVAEPGYFCMLCSSGESVEELIGSMKGASNTADFIQLFDYKREILRKLLPAYVIAQMRVRDGIAKSDSVRNELILLVSGSKNISEAIASAGIKSSKRFILFSSSKKLSLYFAKKNKVKWRKLRLRLDLSTAAEVVGSALSE